MGHDGPRPEFVRGDCRRREEIQMGPSMDADGAGMGIVVAAVVEASRKYGKEKGQNKKNGQFLPECHAALSFRAFCAVFCSILCNFQSLHHRDVPEYGVRYFLSGIGQWMMKVASFILRHNVASSAEVDAVMGQAAKAGAVVVKPAQDTFWGGYAGYFQDPDQHLWEVVWNPEMPLAD
jgi:hypothetical protein